MKIFNTKKAITIIAACAGFITVALVNGCAESKAVAAKGGAILWAENCQRCHNTPPPNTFSQEQWVTVGLHMQSRALLTGKERDKVIEFLQQSN